MAACVKYTVISAKQSSSAFRVGVGVDQHVNCSTDSRNFRSISSLKNVTRLADLQTDFSGLHCIDSHPALILALGNVWNVSESYIKL